LKHLEGDKVSIIVYDTGSRVMCEREKVSPELVRKVKYRGGGTNFVALFKDMASIVEKYKETDNFVVLFMSDG
jgi:hypothetical protein